MSITRSAARGARLGAWRVAWLVGACALTLTPSVFAQQQLAAIQGTITDPSRALLPGVTVTVTNMDTGAVRTTSTNDSGVYRVPSLDPGRYEVTAELDKFRKAVRSDLTLSVGATLGLNMTLEPGVLSVGSSICSNPEAT
jgi:hypothetical protein